MMVNYNKSYWISSSVHGRLHKRSNAINFFPCSDINEPQSEAKRTGPISWSRTRVTKAFSPQPATLCVGIVDKSYCKNAHIPGAFSTPKSSSSSLAGRSQGTESIIIKYSLERKWDDNSMNKLHFRNGGILSPPVMTNSTRILLWWKAATRKDYVHRFSHRKCFAKIRIVNNSIESLYRQCLAEINTHVMRVMSNRDTSVSLLPSRE